jgi:hypothetical protein
MTFPTGTSITAIIQAYEKDPDRYKLSDDDLFGMLPALKQGLQSTAGSSAVDRSGVQLVLSKLDSAIGKRQTNSFLARREILDICVNLCSQ